MDRLFVIGLVAFSSLTAYTAGRRLGKGRSLRLAFVTVLECLGMFLVFLTVNLGLGALIIILVRSITPRFFSLYVLGDITIVFLSILQGFLFQLWGRK
jgi:hypothetical protein